MIKYCVDKWWENKDKLLGALKTDDGLKHCNYDYLVKLTVKNIFNGDDNTWEVEKITEIDNGCYQGTLLYLIPRMCFEPAEYDYLMTYVGYGSCSGCDELESIQCERSDEDAFIRNIMSLCRDIVTNTIMPYNTGWRNKEEFEHIEVNWDVEN
jgi:hypothetical protein